MAPLPGRGGRGVGAVADGAQKEPVAHLDLERAVSPDQLELDAPAPEQSPVELQVVLGGGDRVAHAVGADQPAVREHAPPRGGLVEEQVERLVGQLAEAGEHEPAARRALVLAQPPAAVTKAEAVRHRALAPVDHDAARVDAGLEEVHVVGHDLAAQLDPVGLGGHRRKAGAVAQVERDREARLVEHEPDLLERPHHLDAQRPGVGAVGVVPGRQLLGGAQEVLLRARRDARERLAPPGVRADRAAGVEHQLVVDEQQVVAALGPGRVEMLGRPGGGHQLVAVRLVEGADCGDWLQSTVRLGESVNLPGVCVTRAQERWP